MHSSTPWDLSRDSCWEFVTLPGNAIGGWRGCWRIEHPQRQKISKEESRKIFIFFKTLYRTFSCTEGNKGAWAKKYPFNYGRDNSRVKGGPFLVRESEELSIGLFLGGAVKNPSQRGSQTTAAHSTIGSSNEYCRHLGRAQCRQDSGAVEVLNKLS